MPGEAGGSYEISPAHSSAAAQAANQAAGTLIVFGNAYDVTGGQYDQTSRATATATASRGPAESNVSESDYPGRSQSQINWPLIGTVAGAAVLIAAVLYLRKK
jgi:hypothetical protein